MSAKSKYKRICAVCGKEYKYCNTCRNFSHLPLWMNRYCSEGCKVGFNVACDYAQHLISKEEAKKLLEPLDLSNLENFRDDVKEIIRGIFVTEEDNPKEEQPIIEPKKPARKKMTRRVTTDVVEEDVTAKTSEVSEY